LGFKGDSGGAHLQPDDAARRPEVEGVVVMIGGVKRRARENSRHRMTG